MEERCTEEDDREEGISSLVGRVQSVAQVSGRHGPGKLGKSRD